MKQLKKWDNSIYHVEVKARPNSAALKKSIEKLFELSNKLRRPVRGHYSDRFEVTVSSKEDEHGLKLSAKTTQYCRL